MATAMPGMSELIRGAAIFAEFARISFIKVLSYRMRYVTGIVSYLVYVSANTYIWNAVFSDPSAQASLAGFDRDSMLTYVAIGWIARSFYFNNIDREMAEEVAQGRIAMALLRPFSLQAS